MNERKIKEYVSRYKGNDCYIGPCFMEGLVYDKPIYAISLCNNCKFNLSNKYNHMLCYVTDKRRSIYEGE